MGKIQSCLNRNTTQDNIETIDSLSPLLTRYQSFNFDSYDLESIGSILPVEIWCQIFLYLDKKSKKNASAVCQRWFEIIRNDPRLSGTLVFDFSSIEIPRIKDVKSRDSWPELYKFLTGSKSSFGSSYHTYENSRSNSFGSGSQTSLCSYGSNYYDSPLNHGKNSKIWLHDRLNFQLTEHLEFERLLDVAARIDIVLSKWPVLHTIILKDSSFLRCCPNYYMELEGDPEERYVRKIGYVKEAIEKIQFEQCPTLKKLILDLTIESRCLVPEIDVTSGVRIRLRRLRFNPQKDLNPFSIENVTHLISLFVDQADHADQFAYEPDNFCKALNIIAKKAKNIQFLTLQRTRCSENISSNGFRPLFEKIEPTLEAILFLHEAGWEKYNLKNNPCQENLIEDVFKNLKLVFETESWTLYGPYDLKTSERNIQKCLENVEFVPHFLEEFDEITNFSIYKL